MKALLWGVFFILSSGAKAEDFVTETFWLCLQKRATGPVVRTLRLHYFPTEGRYVTIYTLKGQDQIKCRGKRKRICRKVLEEIKANLEKGLWECSASPPVNVFYPKPAGTENPKNKNPPSFKDKPTREKEES